MVRLHHIIPVLAGTCTVYAAAVPRASKPSPKNPFTNDFEKLVKQAMADWNVPGLSIAVVDDHNVFSTAYGFATLPDVKATPDTLYYAGSTTKAQMDAVLSNLINSKNHSLLEQGWATPISTVIPGDFVLQNQWDTDHLTLDDAASHRTGFSNHDLAWANTNDGKFVTPGDTVRNLRNLPVSTGPRVHFEYNNLIYATLAHVVETLTGEWLGHTLKNVLWGPLGMENTYLSLQNATNSKHQLASGYFYYPQTKKFAKIPDMETDSLSGVGAVISNVKDYSKWIQCLIHEGKPFSKAVHEDIRTPRMLEGVPLEPIPDIAMYGLGWERTVYKGQVVYMHSGNTPTFGAQVIWLPDAKYGVVAMGNTGPSALGAESTVLWKLIHDKLAIPEKERFDFGGEFKKAGDAFGQLVAQGVHLIYPNLPSAPEPPSTGTDDLKGTYSHSGYGTVELVEKPDPDSPTNGTMLVAQRPNMVWDYEMRLKHVTGNYWINYIRTIDIPDIDSGFMKARFEYGSDGSVSGLSIDFVGSFSPEWSNQVITFKKE